MSKHYLRRQTGPWFQLSKQMTEMMHTFTLVLRWLCFFSLRPTIFISYLFTRDICANYTYLYTAAKISRLSICICLLTIKQPGFVLPQKILQEWWDQTDTLQAEPCRELNQTLAEKGVREHSQELYGWAGWNSILYPAWLSYKAGPSRSSLLLKSTFFKSHTAAITLLFPWEE